VEVRPATVSDAQAIGEFIREEWARSGPQAPGFGGATEKLVKEVSSEDFIRGKLADADTRLFVAVEGGKVTGFSSTKKLDARTGELTGIIVAVGERGKGTGSALLQAARESLARMGCSKVIVKTETSNAEALRFYVGLGFAPSGSAQEDVGGTKVEVTILEMQLQRRALQ
jgi:GNAT superfamily N-acetyltransferase